MRYIVDRECGQCPEEMGEFNLEIFIANHNNSRPSSSLPMQFNCNSTVIIIINGVRKALSSITAVDVVFDVCCLLAGTLGTSIECSLLLNDSRP